MTVAERKISWYRAFRAGWLVLAGGNLLFGILNALAGHLGGTVISAAGVMVLVIGVAWISQRIRVLSRTVIHPDYRLIARLEDDIYGERFTHAGGPDMTVRTIGVITERALTRYSRTTCDIYGGVIGYWTEHDIEWESE